MASPFGYNAPFGQASATEEPPSFLPQMTAMGQMLERYAKNRMQLVEIQRRQEAEDRQQKTADAKDAYFKGRLEQGDKKLASQEKQARIKANIDEQNRFRRDPSAGTFTWVDPKTGDVYPINPEFRGGAPAEPPSDQELEALMSRATSPQPQGPQADSPNTIFLDENDQGSARALSGPDDSQHQQLPIEAFPPGATEGQRFNAEDVNLTGGKGNPFAEPVPMPPLQSGAGPQSSSMFVPGQNIQGSVKSTQPQGRRWVAPLPTGEEWVVDHDAQMQAKRADAMDRAELIKQQLQEPWAQNPQMQNQLNMQLAPLMALLGPDIGKTAAAQTFQAGQQDQRLGAQDARQEAQLASNEKIQAAHDATRRATSKYGRGGGGKGIVAQSSGNGSAFSRLKPMEQARIENSVNSGIGLLDREMNWTKLEGVGFDRLNLALQNIRAKGELGGAQQMEAMMNFFGYIRGGVPAKNETDEFKSVTSNLGTLLDRLGQKVDVNGLWTHFTGSQQDREAIAKIAQLPAGQRAGLEQAIIESQKAIQGMALKNIKAQAERYKSAGTPFHERMQDSINSKLRFIGEQPRQWYQDSPLIPDFEAQPQGGAQGGQGKMSDQQLLEALKGMK